jgi:RNA polymerase sigma-70 factor, ECF subfamily
MEALRLDSPDPAWIEPLVSQFSRSAYRLAMMLVNDSDLSSDIVQEAFIRLWQSPRTPHDEVGFKKWLYRTVTNLARDHYRRAQRRHRPWFVFPLPENPDAIAERRQAALTIAEAVRTLSWSEREAIYLRFFEDTPYDEVAKVLGKSVTATRVVVHRALAKLRKRIASSDLPGEG